MTPSEKREEYFKAHPSIYRHYIDIKKNDGNIEEKFLAIKQYAIENT